MNKPKKRLAVSRMTVKQLAQAQLAQAQGGILTDTSSDTYADTSCYSVLKHCN